MLLAFAVLVFAAAEEELELPACNGALAVQDCKYAIGEFACSHAYVPLASEFGHGKRCIWYTAFPPAVCVQDAHCVIVPHTPVPMTPAPATPTPATSAPDTIAPTPAPATLAPDTPAPATEAPPPPPHPPPAPPPPPPLPSPPPPLPPPCPPPPPADHGRKFPEWATAVVLVLIGLVFVVGGIMCVRMCRGLGDSGYRYRMEGSLGGGSFGVVYRVRRVSDGRVYAIKCIQCVGAEDLASAVRETEALHALGSVGHPNMIRVVDLFTDPRLLRFGRTAPTPPATRAGVIQQHVGSPKRSSNCPSRIFIVLPYYPRGDLRKFVLYHTAGVTDSQRGSGGLPEATVLDFTGQLCSLLDFLHRNDPPLVHRDLKPENVLVSHDGQRVIVTDFGLARNLDSTYLHTYYAGTLPFVAPECFRGRCGTEVDMWALGCIAYAMCTRRVQPHNRRFMFDDARLEGFTDQLQEELRGLGYGSTVRDVVLGLLEPDVAKRLSAGDVLEILGTPAWVPPGSSERSAGGRRMSPRSASAGSEYALSADALAVLRELQQTSLTRQLSGDYSDPDPAGSDPTTSFYVYPPVVD